jgi:hypothetical protein
MKLSFSLLLGGIQQRLVGRYHIRRHLKRNRIRLAAMRLNPGRRRISNDGQQPYSSVGSAKSPKFGPCLNVSVSDDSLRVLIRFYGVLGTV